MLGPWQAIKADQEAQLAKCEQAILDGDNSAQLRSYKRRLEKTVGFPSCANVTVYNGVYITCVL